MVWYGMVLYGMLCYGMLWYAMVCYSMLWHAMLCLSRGSGGLGGGNLATIVGLPGYIFWNSSSRACRCSSFLRCSLRVCACAEGAWHSMA